ncbi:hypothetical protein TPHA_0O01330 [Tetrapisispora phaffii CBS 4417]|uniref:Ribonuclease P protein subunit n=1 Tax=Tetrapisispora phaffii (strain ATCC 24235 / CBS 4417 / NBRC 1672 / NRRL Y-8282 / UCD 70-5) TaxID=1071381 RepID=G8C1S3_TETPH|nr:hypothetical protein TPHA_0O01330 [Tetrapisispora phaffii CBS 4417]CCE66101.1 hypothetical protein TPHA_0O01330 [Tetrapisispora phaffii CBS 4417]
MDRAQTFVKECLLSRNFDNPNKPIEEGRLQETLLLLPTDGGITSNLKKNKSKQKLTIENIHTHASKDHGEYKQDNYRTIKKNARVELHDYIKRCRKAVVNAKRSISAYEHDNKKRLEGKEMVKEYLQNNEAHIWEALPKYDTFLPMYEELWLSYIKDLLNINFDMETSEKVNVNGSSALLKLSMADYNGASLKVIRSRNANMIGIEGIIVWDGQQSFIMICKGTEVDELKIIPKKGTAFAFEIPLTKDTALQYTIIGDRLNYRSYDRAGRKFKSRRCDDLLYLINK